MVRDSGRMGKLTRTVEVLKTTVHLRRGRVAFGHHPRTQGWLPVLFGANGTIRLGAGAWFRGVEARATLRVDHGGVLTVGDRALINSGASIQCGLEVTIGDDFLMAAFASIADTDMHEIVPGSGVRAEPVIIGDSVWLGRGAFVLPGVTIGDGAVIGAGSVVTKDVRAWTVVAGNPARELRSITPLADHRS
jgi:acetyltransferase-like isoleucine patch superfamily enzyme